MPPRLPCLLVVQSAGVAKLQGRDRVMGRITLMLVGAVVAAIATGSADAQESSAAIKERREHMKAMGGSMQSIGKYLKGEGVTLDQARGAATSLRQHADANL